VSAQLASSAFAGTWREEQTIPWGGRTRYYRVYMPDTLVPNHPVVFLLHGGGGSMREVTRNGSAAEWPEIADEAGFLLIVPNGVDDVTGDSSGDDQQWNDCRGDAAVSDPRTDDVGFLGALVDRVFFEFDADPERVYATGASNGGMMSYRLAFEAGDRFAAVAAFIANLPAVSECASPTRRVPVFLCNGDAETYYMPWNGGCVASAACERGTVVSALETRDFWIAHNGTSPSPSQTIPYPDIFIGDRTTVASELFTGGAEGSEVMFYRVNGGGHTEPSIEHPFDQFVLLLLGLGWQNRDIEGSRQAWSFLSRHTLNGPRPGGHTPGAVTELRALQNPDGTIQLRWNRDCGGGTAYAVYRGNLAVGYGSLSPEPGCCAVMRTTVKVPAGPGAADFFLLVPNDGHSEGGYGTVSDGSPRPPATQACLPPGPVDSCVGGGE
jgi:polyhydroxybutyrate depolymerase